MLDCEIIVVDDSHDKTAEIAEKMGCKVIKGIAGYGKALIEGLKVAKGDYVVMLDADGSYSPKDIPNLLEPLIKDKADFVIGSRLKGKIMPKAMPWHHRYIGNPILTWIMNVLFKTNVSDAHSGMRALRKSALNKLNLKCPGMELASEMIIEAKKMGLRIAEIPINYYPRRGESKLRSFRDGWRHLRFMLLYSPTYLFFIPGLVILIAGLIVTLYVLFLNPIRYHTQIFGSLLVVLGIQTIFFGITVKIQSVEMKLVKHDVLTKLFDKPSVVEWGILIGLILILIGVVFGYYIINVWLRSNFGNLNFLNIAILAFVLIVAGVQIVFNVLFISSLKILNEKYSSN